MDKREFLARLQRGLSGLPRDDVEQRLAFYGEMIDDCTEEGLSEQEAVSRLGDIDEIVSQAVADIPLSRLVKDKLRSKRTLRAWEIVLLALGSPIWLSLLVAALAVVFTLYVLLWAAVVCLWCVFGSLVCCAAGGAAAGVVFACGGNVPAGLAVIGAGAACAGLSIFMFFVCLAATKGVSMLTKKIVISVKSRFIKKEGA